MQKKVTAILGSVRFWLITATAALAIGEVVYGGSDVIRILEIWLASIAGIGTLDSVATRISGVTSKKK